MDSIVSYESRSSGENRLVVHGTNRSAQTEGASEQELEDPAVADLALRKIFEEHFEEIRIDPELTDETFAMVSTQASLEDLPEIAVQAREEGRSGIGYYLECDGGLSRGASYCLMR
jgi:hypothetical protein